MFLFVESWVKVIIQQRIMFSYQTAMHACKLGLLPRRQRVQSHVSCNESKSVKKNTIELYFRKQQKRILSLLHSLSTWYIKFHKINCMGKLKETCSWRKKVNSHLSKCFESFYFIKLWWLTSNLIFLEWKLYPGDYIVLLTTLLICLPDSEFTSKT